MSGSRDPIQRASSGDIDLYDIVDWESRSSLDRLSTRVYGGIKASLRVIVILLALLILASQFLLSGLAAVRSPMLGVYILFSVLPALLLAAYVWKVDVTMREPLELLVGTFVLGVLFAGFAAILNSYFKGAFLLFGGVGLVLFFYVIVAPVEETVKWLAIRLFAYRSTEFDAVIDGAVYGAMAGLGFATIENTIYIAQPYLQAAGVQAGLDEALQTAAVRTLAGPGHVIYSAFAGYYLGLAKFNPENRGPIVVKGLLIAAFIHGTYNSIVSNLGLVIDIVPGLSLVPSGLVFLGFIVVYDGIFLLALYRKLSAYRNAFVATGATDIYSEDAASTLPADDEVSVADERDPITGDADTEPRGDETEDATDAPTNSESASNESTDDESGSIFDALFVDDTNDSGTGGSDATDTIDER